MKQSKSQRLGETYLFIEMAIFSLFPLIINAGTKIMPPLFFAGVSLLTAAVFFFVYLAFTGQLKQLQNKAILKLSTIITLLVVVIPYFAIFTGTKLTSGINTAIFLQTEILFALVLCKFWLKEKISRFQMVGSISIFIGALFVLYSGHFGLNMGDLLIILGTSIYPLGNVYSKKALEIASPMLILFIRSLFGGIILIALSLLFEKQTPFSLPLKTLELIIINGLGMMFISKILWYEGLKRLSLTKATAITMSYPIFTLIFAAIFLKEIPTLYQLVGLTIIMFGVYLTTAKPAEKDVNSN